uniref:CBF1-interacting co-repressor CIR N-terminal domain-containing protein n=1 Tax=Pristionchus pacificus TaxID=54126 RepID=A0A8R1Z772_PRIPA
MNILPKKRWHVRTKENMARVRKDVKKAEEEEKAILDREITATNEARLSALRNNAKTRVDTMFGVRRTDDVEIVPSSSGHINFFEELEMAEAKNVGDTNNEYEEEKKKEHREWEAKMGIQMKLGDDGNEGKGYWFDKIPLRRGVKEMKKIEEEQKRLAILDNTKKTEKEKRKKGTKREDSEEEAEDDEKRKRKKSGKKHRKHKKEKKEKKEMERKNVSSSDSENDEELRRKEETEKKLIMEKLRDERIRRERMEQAKTQLILHPELGKKKEEEARKSAPKYNSMFNPHLSR